MLEDNEDGPASAIVTSKSGHPYDMNNIPGSVKKRLIDSGEFTEDQFSLTGDMPGRVRKARIAELGLETKPKTPTLDINKLEEGDLVSYKGTVTEVKKVSVEKGTIYIDISGKKKGWVNIDKFKPVVIPPGDNDEE